MTTRSTPPPPRLRKTEQREQTITRILDAAEALFARNGFHGATLKDVAKAGGVDPALIHHYFGDKTQLFNATFGRRAAIANQVRMEALDTYEAQSAGRMTVDGVIDAFVGATFDMLNRPEKGWLNYGVLVAQVNNTPEWGGETMRLHFDPLVRRFIGMLKSLAPDLPDEDVYWFYHLLSGSLTLTLAQTGRIDALSEGICRSEDIPAVRRRMTPLFAAGFRDLAQRGGASIKAAD